MSSHGGGVADASPYLGSIFPVVMFQSTRPGMATHRRSSLRFVNVRFDARSGEDGSALELVYFGLQALQFRSLVPEPLRLTSFGLSSLDLQPVGLEALLAATFPLEPLSLLGCGLPLGFAPFRLFGLGAFGFYAIALAALRLDLRPLHPLKFEPMRLHSFGFQPRCRRPLPLRQQRRQSDRPTGGGGRRRIRSSRWQRCPGHRLPTSALSAVGGIQDSC